MSYNWNMIFVPFTKNNPIVCRTYLLRKIPAEQIDEAVNRGYIILHSINDIGDEQYILTDKGRKFRDNGFKEELL